LLTLLAAALSIAHVFAHPEVLSLLSLTHTHSHTHTLSLSSLSFSIPKAKP
jgi:hypothetical protein